MFNANTLLIWLMILISIGIIGGITYLYTKNKHITFIAVLVSIIIIGIFILSGTLSVIFSHQFIGRYDDLGVPYVYAKPGWSQIINGWSIWILPVLISILLIMIMTALIPKKVKNVALVSTEEHPSLHHPSTSFTHMTEKLGKDTFKNTVTDSMEKLAEALLSITAQEHKIAELTEQLHKSHEQVDDKRQDLEDQISLLQLQLNAATNENQQLANRLESCKTELELSHQMFNKLLEYKQNEGES